MFAVIFEVHPRPQHWDDYLGHAGLLRPELFKIDGFLTNERFASRDRPGWLVSLSFWRDEKALIRWRTHALHQDSQWQGRSQVFADYHLRVGEVMADSDLPTGDVPVQQRFDTTETGAAKTVSVSEQRGEAAPWPLASDQPDAGLFESITTPGNILRLISWREQAPTLAQFAATPGRHRLVRVIRDYGMFNRFEAPQFFPAVTADGTP